jgi:hypothetical protein
MIQSGGARMIFVERPTSLSLLLVSAGLVPALGFAKIPQQWKYL